MFSPFRWFFDVNRKLYSSVAKIFPNTKFSIYSYYIEQVKDSLFEGCLIVDIGGGKSCRFASERKRFSNMKIIALDVSAEELSFNHDADEKIVFDISSGEHAPLEDGYADIITSSSVLEHIQNLENAIKEVSRLLKPGGKFISVLPCKFALFALINQLIPNWFARKILFFIFPYSKGYGGFKAYYNRCYYPALQNLLEKHGFTDIHIAFQYNQSSYFSFFILFGVIALVWDCIMYALKFKPLAGYMCFTSQKAHEA